jgi:hypothetical protein
MYKGNKRQQYSYTSNDEHLQHALFAGLDLITTATH